PTHVASRLALAGAETVAAGDGYAYRVESPGPGGFSWYVLEREHLWSNNGEMNTTYLVTTDPAEIRWAHDAWANTWLHDEAAYRLTVYEDGASTSTVDLSREGLREVPPLTGRPLPDGVPAVTELNGVSLLVHYGYSTAL